MKNNLYRGVAGRKKEEKEEKIKKKNATAGKGA